MRASIFLFFIILLFSCNQSKSNMTFDEKDAINTFIELSPQQGAFFYLENRTKYNFLDQFYHDFILPAIKDCDYYDIKGIYFLLKDTPVGSEVFEYYLKSRSEYLYDIKREIDEFEKIQKDLLDKEILPLLEVALDSMLHEDINNVLDNYSGGVLNYKKINLLISAKDSNSRLFNRCWSEMVDVEKYNQQINEHLSNFVDQVKINTEMYYQDITMDKHTTDFDLKLPKIKLDLSENIIQYVQNYTDNENKALIIGFLKDFLAPSALALTKIGLLVSIYEIGSLAYDVKVIVDDVKQQKPTSEELLHSICMSEIINVEVSHCMKQYRVIMRELIESNNAILYKKISFRL